MIGQASARLMAMLVVGLARAMTGVRPDWRGCLPEARQRSYFANHASHGDFVLIWTVLPPHLRRAAGARQIEGGADQGEMREALRKIAEQPAGAGIIFLGDQAEIIGDAGDALGVPGGPVEAEGAAPVVADQHHPVQALRVEPGVEVAGVVGEGVAEVRLAGAAHADEVGREHPPAGGEHGRDVPPGAGAAGVAVQQDVGGAGAGPAVLLVVEVGVEDGGLRHGLLLLTS